MGLLCWKTRTLTLGFFNDWTCYLKDLVAQFLEITAIDILSRLVASICVQLEMPLLRIYKQECFGSRHCI